MAIKRGALATQTDRPLKQSKLSFGRKMASSSAPTAKSTTSKDEQETESQTSKPEVAKEEIGDSPTATPAPPATSNGFTLTEITGDIFSAPDNAIIIHACNCIGSWGAGIAAAFKQRYPRAYEAYSVHCEANTPDSLIGTALLIPPSEAKGRRHYVGCLFTSKRFGRARDKPDVILGYTTPAMEDLISAVVKDGGVEAIRMCQINSGLFGVPWEDSKALIAQMEVPEEVPKKIEVYSLPNPPIIGRGRKK